MSFDKDFLWGVAGAAAQQEGGATDGGKGPTIWDAPYTQGKIKHNDDNSVACDYYNKWKDDFKLLKEIGVRSYRFSICPARIFPYDDKIVNEEGIEFYKDIVVELRKLGIEPLVTLYHWDLPLWLNDKGGWENPIAIEWFEKYAETVVKALSDKVAYWMTFNEPAVFVGCGYMNGSHAPWNKLDMRGVHTVSRNVMLAHGRAVKAIRKFAKISPKAGVALSTPIVLPVNGKTEQEAYLKSTDAMWNGVWNVSWWADPMVLGKRSNGCDWITDAELKEMCQPLDFFGFNIYHAEHTPDFPCEYTGMPYTTMGWSITPDCLYYCARFLYKRYNLPLIVTENGMANIDFVYDDGKIHDPQRSEFLRTHIRGLKKANDEGVPIIGYTCWSFMDNFEWAEGYRQRFGLVYVDYGTQKRTLKDSAYTYRDIIKANGDNL